MIRKLSALLTVTLMLIAAPVLAAGGTTYGTGISLKEATSISTLIASPGDYAGKKVMVRGLVVDVCAARGCWMEISSDKPYEKIRVKVEDGAIVFPVTARGKQATVEGILETIAMCPDEASKYRQQEARAKGIAFSPSMVTGKESYLALKVAGAQVE